MPPRPAHMFTPLPGEEPRPETQGPRGEAASLQPASAGPAGEGAHLRGSTNTSQQVPRVFSNTCTHASVRGS